MPLQSTRVSPQRHREHGGHGERKSFSLCSPCPPCLRGFYPCKSFFLRELRVLRASVVPIHPTPGTYRNPPLSIIDPLLMETTRKRYQERFYHGDTESTEATERENHFSFSVNSVLSVFSVVSTSAEVPVPCGPPDRPEWLPGC